MSEPLPFRPLLIYFIVATVINKGFLLYFGINYSLHPGHGYGWGLTITLVYTVAAAGYLIYKYRAKE